MINDELITSLPEPETATELYLAAILQRLDIIANIQATEAAAKDEQVDEGNFVRCLGGEIIDLRQLQQTRG